MYEDASAQKIAGNLRGKDEGGWHRGVRGTAVDTEAAAKTREFQIVTKTAKQETG